MDEQEIIINENDGNISVNIELHQINAVEATDEVPIVDLSSEGRVDVVTEENIVIEEMTTANEMLNVVIDHSRYLPNQHTIGAITGLRTELDNIEALQDTVYAQNTNCANYYLWQDENPLQLNREGFFVALNPNGTIKICDNADEIFGVVVPDAGFVGGQDDMARDHRYGLVSSTGLVAVRCESGVAIGNFVRTNNFGVAQNSTYGYKVVSVSTIGGVNCATISLVLSATEFANVGTNVQSLNTRMDNAETNIATAINVANAAHSLTVATNVNAIATANEALTKANTATDTVESIGTRVTNMESEVAIARASAETAANTAANIRNQAIEAINQAVADAQTASRDAESARDEATAMAQDALREAQQAATDAENAFDDIDVIKKNVYGVATDVAKYYIGEHSQADGLSYSVAQSLMVAGMIYVPTITHVESYASSPSEVLYTFTKGHYYTWGTALWDDAGNATVTFSGTRPTEGTNAIYWVPTTTVTNDEIAYVQDYLYQRNIDGIWSPVATPATAYNISLVKQTSDSLKVAIGNAQGSLAELDTRVGTNESSISSLTSFRDNGYITLDAWPVNTETVNKSRVYYVTADSKYHYYNGTAWATSEEAVEAGLTESIAHIKQLVNDNGSSITSSALHNSRGCTRVSTFASSGATASYIIGDEPSTDADTDNVYYDKSSQLYWYYNVSTWVSTPSPSAAGLVESIAMVQQTADANESVINIITSHDSTDSRTIAYVNAKADANAGSIESLASYVDKSYISIDSWSEAGKDVTKVYYAKDDEFYYYYLDGIWKQTIMPSDAGLSNAIAYVSQKADNNESNIASLTRHNGEFTSSLTQLQQKSNADGGLIQGLVADIDKYSVGEYSQAHGLTLARARDILEPGMAYIPTTSHDETYTDDTTNFAQGYSYIWNGNSWDESDSQDVFFSAYYPVSTTNFWYVNSDNDAYGALADVGVVNRDINIVYYTVGSTDTYYYYNDGAWVSTTSPSNIDGISVFKAHTLYKWKPDIILPNPDAQGTSVLDGGALGGA